MFAKIKNAVFGTVTKVATFWEELHFSIRITATVISSIIFPVATLLAIRLYALFKIIKNNLANYKITKKYEDNPASKYVVVSLVLGVSSVMALFAGATFAGLVLMIMSILVSGRAKSVHDKFVFGAK